MKLLLTTIAAVVLVGCGESQQSAPAPETKPAEPVVEAAKPETPTAKAPDISIHEAAEGGNLEAVKQHLAAGTDVDAKNNDEWTALHVAAGEGQKEITELLIAKGADVNANTPDGLTVFFAAILGANKEIIELLIAKGADVNVRGFGGMTPLNMADDEGEKEIADLLRKYGAKTSDWLKAGESIHIAAKAGHIEAIKKHLAAGADVNAKSGPFGLTPLHYAAYRENKEVVELLIAEGADVNAQRDDGQTPLARAIFNKRTDTADLLRKHGGKTAKELKAEGK